MQEESQSCAIVVQMRSNMQTMDGELKLNSGQLFTMTVVNFVVSYDQIIICIIDEGSEAAFPPHCPGMGQLPFL